jgi:hypothetical protein
LLESAHDDAADCTMPRIGTNTLGNNRWRQTKQYPMVKTDQHPEHGMSIRMITKPMANRLKNAPSSAGVYLERTSAH